MEHAVNVTNKRIYPHRSLETEACKHDGVRVLRESVFGVEIVREVGEFNTRSDDAIKDADCQNKTENILTAWLMIK